jgi:hypothetical protein
MAVESSIPGMKMHEACAVLSALLKRPHHFDLRRAARLPFERGLLLVKLPEAGSIP